MSRLRGGGRRTKRDRKNTKRERKNNTKRERKKNTKRERKKRGNTGLRGDVHSARAPFTSTNQRQQPTTTNTRTHHTDNNSRLAPTTGLSIPPSSNSTTKLHRVTGRSRWNLRDITPHLCGENGKIKNPMDSAPQSLHLALHIALQYCSRPHMRHMQVVP